MRNKLDVAKAKIALPALYAANIRPVKAAPCGKCFLRHPGLLTEFSHALAESLQYRVFLVHSKRIWTAMTIVPRTISII